MPNKEAQLACRLQPSNVRLADSMKAAVGLKLFKVCIDSASNFMLCCATWVELPPVLLLTGFSHQPNRRTNRRTMHLDSLHPFSVASSSQLDYETNWRGKSMNARYVAFPCPLCRHISLIRSGLSFWGVTLIEPPNKNILSSISSPLCIIQ